MLKGGGMSERAGQTLTEDQVLLIRKALGGRRRYEILKRLGERPDAHASRPVFRDRAASELGRGRHPAYRKRPARRALGRHPGRGDARVFEERAAHVRGQISRLTAAAKQTRNPDTSSACNPPPTEFEEERHDRRQDTSALKI